MVTIFMLLHIFSVTSISEILFPQSLVARKGRRKTRLKERALTIRQQFIYISGKATVPVKLKEY